MADISSRINRGILNLPGVDANSKSTTEQLLKQDYTSHHCLFRPGGLHNHLSHHILAAYDLGAPTSLIQAIYEDEAKIQRPIDLRENGIVPEEVLKADEISEKNWTRWLGDDKVYAAYVTFFSNQIAHSGISKTLENYVFSPAANDNGSHMLFRLVGGVLHPFIQVGYGVEFDSEIQVAAGLAQAAVHAARAELFLPSAEFVDWPLANGTHTNGKGRQPQRGPSILSILQQIYASPKLTPVLPYDPDALLSKRLSDFMEGGTRPAELKRIFSQFDPGDTEEELDARIEELVFASTLLTFGTGKKNRKPRLDFFLMHLLTSSLFVSSFLTYIPHIENRRTLFRTFLQSWGTVLMTRGRPRIDPVLLMSYTDHPLPPDVPRPVPHPSAIGAGNQESVNPFPAIIADVLHAPGSHTVKALRTLLHGATRYGTVPKGGVIGAFGEDGKETHHGIKDVDGTVFVRAAGLLMEGIGWITFGQEAKTWDRSALGWDDAWAGDD